MLKLIEKDFTTYNPVETWYCESTSELADIPESAPAGSIAQVLTSSGLTVKMKNSAGSWIDLFGQDIISAGFKVQVEDNRSILNRQGEEKVLYLLPKEYGSSQNGYDEFVYANGNWEWVGKTDVNLDYEALDNKPQINGVELTGNRTTSDLNIETGTDDYKELNNLPQIENYSPNQSETTNELKNTVSFYPFTSSVSRNGKLYLRFDETTVIKCNTATNTISSLDSLPEDIHNSFTYFQYIGAQQIAPFINPKNNSLSLFDYRPTNFGWTQLLFWEDATTNEPKCAFRYTSRNSLMYNVQFKELGSQIVSGVVNANGTITFTDSEGNSFTTSGSNLVTSGNEQISVGYDNGGFYFLFDDGQEEANNGTD